MKFGQALSPFESVLPEDVAAPYRAHLARLQDAAPPMPTSRVHAVLAREFGPRWRQSFADFDPLPAAAHPSDRCTRPPGPMGVRSRSRSNTRERMTHAFRSAADRTAVEGHRAAGWWDGCGALVDELTARVTEELDYTLEAGSQQQAAVGFAGSNEFYVPPVLASTPKVMVSEWVEGAPLSSAATSSRQEAQRGRDAVRAIPVRGRARLGLRTLIPPPWKLQTHEGWPAAWSTSGWWRVPDGLPPPRRAGFEDCPAGRLLIRLPRDCLSLSSSRSRH